MRMSVTFEIEGDFAQPGFKPFLWKLVSDAHLGGWVTDSLKPECVILHLTGEDETIRAFIRPLPGVIMQYRMRRIELLPESFLADMNIPESPDGSFRVIVPADKSMPEVAPDSIPCPDCLAEMLDPGSRRYRYPFFSCARCGSSYSMLLRNPFLRNNTVFCAFPPCTGCRSEENNRDDAHHFGAPLLACPDCGPRLFLLNSEGENIGDEHCIEQARKTLQEGKIVALRSVFGGFQLFADAHNDETVRELRRRKKMPMRPLALMARDMEAVRRICSCSPEEEQLLLSKAAPVVILDIRDDAHDLLSFGGISPDGPRVGVSLPPTMMMRLLFEQTGEDPVPAFDYLITICSNWPGGYSLNGVDELIYSLRGVADLFLCNDLRVGMDSASSIAVIRDGAPQIWRRSRGYAPRPIRLAHPLKRIAVAFGSDVNSSVAMARGDKIVLSQHLGDILNFESAGRLTSILERYTVLFDTVPDVVVCDMNPHLRSSEEAKRFADRFSLPLLTVETHHAHALAGMAENRLEHALAVVLSSGEPGPDGNLWGAEVMDVTPQAFNRIGTFCPVGFPGRENMLMRPMRQLTSRLYEAGVLFSPSLIDHYHLNPEEIQIWQKAHSEQDQILQTHSAARLFDAVSAGLGLAPHFVGYRGQTAVRLEYAALEASGGLQAIPEWMYHKFDFTQYVDEQGKLMIDWQPVFRNFADPSSWITQENVPYLALAFHVKIADAISAMVHHGEAKTGLRDILLSGSLFMNGILQKMVLGKLRSEKYRVFIHRSVPMDESGLSVGQAFHGAW